MGTADMTAEETFEREMRPLKEIKDNYEKIVLTKYSKNSPSSTGGR